MDLGLNGLRALVTGASRGLGFATAQVLAAEGVSQGRPVAPFQGVCVGRFCAKRGQGMLDAAGDAELGIGEGAVQIKEKVGERHNVCLSALLG